MKKPETCGQCERYVIVDGREFCAPIKEKYGWTPVSGDQKPDDNCPYDFSKCDCGEPLADGRCTDENCKRLES